MAAIGLPVSLTVAGDAYTTNARIMAIVWQGATSSGDTVELQQRGSGGTIWKGRTDSSQTYQGISFGRPGLACPSGFTLAQISNGEVLVYLLED
jgi:hypothetical protein